MFTLSWQPPYDWSWMLGFLAARAVDGVETVGEGFYARSLVVGEHRGLVSVRPHLPTHTVQVSVSAGLLPVAPACLAKVSRLFDLDCQPAQVAAVLGQLVSVAMAAKLTAKVARRYGEALPDAPDYVCFPGPETLALADPLALKALGMPLRRAEALIHLAQATLAGKLALAAPPDIEQSVKNLQTFPGIGRWTANYFALRGWQAKDIFLPDDYLIKQRFAGMTPAQIRRYAERWKPWRSYALLHIWYTHGWQPSMDSEIAGIQ
ncbi:DNA-3-methyladenine glycosylase 2 [Salmonella enterica subsp. enterica serovar Arechavaleta]|uniref:DNA-3-methyladenine glycosylase II n=1 Tax=Salmonella enterica TaxID=28901 RepID=A0A755S0K7_SALER|nr:DNA-3-methyladenine glycosylase 2 [Salmonella enterica subsp. enterica serovar Arechavaleta]EAO6397818.1 DNA-3-methyladenine glycosylase 2 [Salmonella enterica]EBF8681094.1 DNA-3-methyladenine glycosylase 2 [Salmonella enterica subsp. enterica]EDB4404386.1 DNA-3-methyladenine glycosylase 2 [Salmonella enterica subsp. enterica serovar Schwarzengrund]EAW0406496.1 DNA-3-methyladenine glycosylase 2 [Salmonella enterica]